MPTPQLETRFDTPSAHESWNSSSNILYRADSHRIGDQHHPAPLNPCRPYQMRTTMLPRSVSASDCSSRPTQA